ncbi:MAG TPA: hypothetical protein VHW74_15110 [Mycobacteriales bacterium]|nr:hypothetical protein [Mycobacteriales bacterium]
MRPGIETRQVLLALGALCLIVAFSAGTALVWSSLGGGGQLVLMTSVTTLLLGGAATLKRLPATSEALGTVGLAGCAVDAIAARTLHLADAAGVPLHWYVTASALAVAAVSVGLWAARPSLVGPRLVGAVATGSAWVSLAAMPQLFADIDFVLAASALVVAFAWPRHNTLVRDAAFGMATVLGTIASTITLDLHSVTTPEAYVATPAALTLIWAGTALLDDRHLTSTVLVPGLTVGLFPTFVRAMATHDGTRQLVLLVIATVLVASGAELRLATPMAAGAGVITLLGLRVVGPDLALVPHWIIWAAAGAILLTLGATWEARLADIRQLKGSLQPRIEALR